MKWSSRSGRWMRNLNSMRAQFAKLGCPKCYSVNILIEIGDDCHCAECYLKFDFAELLTFQQVRDKKINTIIT
jgi:hypothetical protein